MWWKSLAILISFVVITISGDFASAACPSADITGDCFVDFEDFAIMAAQWPTTDFNDLEVIANQWLTTDPCVPDDMAYIPDGEFDMGDHHGDEPSDKLPVHTVLLDSFFMGKYDVTNGQYCQYLNSALGSRIYVSGGIVYGSGNNQPYCDTSTMSSYSQIAYSGGVFSVRIKGGRNMSNDPIVRVSWYGAAAYCNWRSQQKGYESLYDPCDPYWPCDFNNSGYRLATEAEWEYAARGGLSGKRFPWGDTITHRQANYYSRSLYSYDISPTRGYHPDCNDRIIPYTLPVGSFPPNGYGIYDMTGNDWNWCNDWYSSTYYSSSPSNNPTGPTSGSYRVLRGGGWNSFAIYCLVSYRSYFNNDFLSNYNGFRVVLDLN